MNRSIRTTVIILVLIVVLVFGFAIVRQAWVDQQAASAPAPDLSGLHTYVYDQGQPLADYSLTDENGDTATPGDLKGHWTFAFIGYTSCPDICPTILSTLQDAKARLPVDIPQPSVLMVTADPDQDTPAVLKRYLQYFGPGFHGLTGDVATLRALARSMNGDFSRRTDGDGQQQVDHSAHLALIDPNGQMIAVFQPPHTADTLVRAYTRVYQWARQQQSGLGGSAN